MSFRTGNPALKEESFLGFEWYQWEVMSLQWTVNKSYLLLWIAFLSAMIFWLYAGVNNIFLWMIVWAIVSLILAIIISFKPTTAPKLAVVYALFEWVFLWAISMYFEMMFPWIVLQAVSLTFAVFLWLLLAYQSGLIKATENFKLWVTAATLGIFIVYLLNFILSLFGLNVMPFIHEGGTLGIIFSVVVVIIAALNLVLDFDFIENWVENKAPKYMEWYAAFGLLVTLAWLYVEILRLLAKLRWSE